MSGEPWDPVERDRRYASCKRAGLARLVSEGDSWFDYPPHPNIIDWLDGEGLWGIKRFEKSGDTLENMASDANLSRIAATAQKEKPDAILFSAGGNDLFTDIPEKPKLRWIWRALNPYDAQKTAAEHVNALAWDEKKTELRRGFVRVIAALGEYAPIVMHGYDYLTASGEKVKYDGFRPAGPWILPSMQDRGIYDAALQQTILRVLIDDVNQILAALENTYPDSVIYLNLRGTLRPGIDWMNEIHPTEDGFHKIEERFRDALIERLPAVQQQRNTQ
jgi:lysophospholipase L1-like esterase